MNATQPNGIITPTGQDEFSPYQPFGRQPAPKKPSRARKILTAAAALIILLIGVGIGSAGRPPAPAAEVRTETKTVTKEIPVTPQACLTALDLNEEAFDYASASLKSIMRGDYTAAGETTAKIRDITPRATAAKAECRAAK